MQSAPLAVVADDIGAATWLAAQGLPWWPLVGALVAVIGIWLFSRLLDTNAWTAAGRLLAPLASLGRALIPLLLSVTVVAAFALQVVGRPLQVLAGVALAALIWLFVRGGGEFEHERSNIGDLRDVWRPSTPWPARMFVVPVVGVAVAAVFIGVAFGNPLSLWTGPGGLSGGFEYVAIFLLAVAASLRLLGYATNWWRRITAIALALLLARTLAWAGVLPLESELNEVRIAFGPAALVLLAVVVGAFVVEAWRQRTPAARPPAAAHRLARAYGFWAALASSLLLLGALSAAAWETTEGAAGSLSDDFGALEPTSAPAIVDTPGNEDLDLAWTFAPVLHLHGDEDYPPIRVEDFLRGSFERGARGVAANELDLGTLPSECQDADHDACGTIECPECVLRKRETQPEGFDPRGGFYARVVRRANQPLVLGGWNPWGTDLATLIQYWVFYGYNRWQAETIVGRLTQEHEGDWEVVSVGLDARNKPLFAALSAHCGGQVVPWDEITATPGSLQDGRVVVAGERASTDDDVAHPVVAVARGSHANYAVSAGHRPPDWGSCKRLPSEALAGLSYASNVRDLTDDSDGGWFVYPKEMVLVTRSEKPMSYPGAWGAGETITFGHRDPVRTSRSPLSPPLQRASWRTPVQLYFCHSHWYDEGDGDPSMHGSRAQCRMNRDSSS